MRVLHYYRKNDIYDKAAALETIMTAACWSPQRKFDAGMITIDQNVCHNCGAAHRDDYHQFWSCPKHAHSEWPEISNTQYLLPKAELEVGNLPSLWLRGLLPLDMCGDVNNPIPPPVDDLNVTIYDPDNDGP